MKIVYVKWFDASYQRGEHTIDELVPEVILESVGILIREDKKTVSFAMDYNEAEKIYRYISHVPKVNIIKIRRITL